MIVALWIWCKKVFKRCALDFQRGPGSEGSCRVLDLVKKSRQVACWFRKGFTDSPLPILPASVNLVLTIVDR